MIEAVSKVYRRCIEDVSKMYTRNPERGIVKGLRERHVWIPGFAERKVDYVKICIDPTTIAEERNTNTGKNC